MKEFKCHEYPVIGYVYSEAVQGNVPVLDIPQMSDERWQELEKLHPVRNEECAS